MSRLVSGCIGVLLLGLAFAQDEVSTLSVEVSTSFDGTTPTEEPQEDVKLDVGVRLTESIELEWKIKDEISERYPWLKIIAKKLEDGIEVSSPWIYNNVTEHKFIDLTADSKYEICLYLRENDDGRIVKGDGEYKCTEAATVPWLRRDTVFIALIVWATIFAIILCGCLAYKINKTRFERSQAEAENMLNDDKADDGKGKGLRKRQKPKTFDGPASCEGPPSYKRPAAYEGPLAQEIPYITPPLTSAEKEKYHTLV